ncbi:MAG: flavin reductase family protein [Alphaproteobacteria bacterium]|nr:flavin reductase family protein [Alphaproteobacteria bacterium]
MSQEDASAIQPPIGKDQLRDFAASFATGVVVLTTKGKDGTLFGLTMNAVSCVCLEPPTFLACVDKGSATLAPLLETGAFALNILARDQETVSNTFASKTPDKFAEIDHSEGTLGVPLITGALAAAEFRVAKTVEVGDHVIVLGEAVASRQGDGAPLGYFRGKYADIGS